MAEQSKPYNITPIQMGKSNAYLVSGPDLVLLIDSGCAKNIRSLEIALIQNELQITDLDYIIVTHSHYDHVGHLAEIKEKSGAKVLAHRNAVDYLKKGHTPFPEGTMLPFKMISKMGNRFFSSGGRFTPVEPDIVIEEDYDLSTPELSVSIIHTPGHTSGSICVIINIIEDRFARDVRPIVHYGTGDLEITIKPEEDLKKAEGLIAKSYENS